MRYSASDKTEIIRLVEQSPLPARRTLDKLGVPRSSFYRWYDRNQRGGPEALADRPSRPDRVWNRIPEAIRSQIVDLALTDTPSAAVRALDERTGAPLWQFDPAPADAGSRLDGGRNVWAPMAADAASGMVFLPTASPSAAFFGGERPGEDL